MRGAKAKRLRKIADLAAMAQGLPKIAYEFSNAQGTMRLRACGRKIYKDLKRL